MRRGGGPGDPGRDDGATAVEFALVAPLLMMVLFGIIQYGYGLYQLQAFRSTVDSASRLAATGVMQCSVLDTRVQQLADGNGLDPAKLGGTAVRWTDPAGSPATGGPVRLGQAVVTMTYEPFRIGAPLIPFPQEFRQTSSAQVQDVGLSTLAGC